MKISLRSGLRSHVALIELANLIERVNLYFSFHTVPIFLRGVGHLWGYPHRPEKKLFTVSQGRTVRQHQGFHYSPKRENEAIRMNRILR